MKDRINKIIKSKAFPYITLFFVMLCLNIFKSTVGNDDSWFATITTGSINSKVINMSSYMKWRYNTWSSRLIVEFFLIEFSQNFGTLWKVLDAGIYVLLAYSIYKVFCNSKNDENSYKKWIIVFLVALIPQNLLNSAGWIATSLNYLWVVAFGIFALIPIRKCIDSEKFGLIETVLYIFSMIYAVNVEQMCLVLFTVYFVFLIYLLKKKKIKPIIIVLFIISVLSLIFILTCPGNSARTESEIKSYFPDFEEISVLEKISISFISTMKYYIFEFNIIYVIFTILILKRVWKKYDCMFIKAIAIFPFIMGIAFNIASPITSMCFPKLFEEISIINNLTSENGYISIVVATLFSAAIISTIVISVYLAFGNTKKCIIAILCIGAGICTRMLMGFMPSVYVSGNRTQFIFIISMIIISILIIDEEKEETLKKYIDYLIAFEILTIMNSMSLILRYH